MKKICFKLLITLLVISFFKVNITSNHISEHSFNSNAVIMVASDSIPLCPEDYDDCKD